MRSRPLTGPKCLSLCLPGKGSWDAGWAKCLFAPQLALLSLIQLFPSAFRSLAGEDFLLSPVSMTMLVGELQLGLAGLGSSEAK